MNAVIYIVDMLAWGLMVLVITQMVISLVFAFNIVDTSNQFLWQVYRSIGAFLEPVLGPIRRILPSTGAIDFSPMVLIFGLYALSAILREIPA